VPLISVSGLPYAYGQPPAAGTIRETVEDFVVTEALGYAPDEEGQHALLLVEKQGCNTEWVAQQLKTFAGVRPVDVGFAGLKDRHAVTRQWFSVDLAGKPAPDWMQFQSSGYRVIEWAWHRRKLRRGGLRGNGFRVVVRNLSGDLAALRQRLSQVARGGVPNYFGEQRFGYDNLEQAARFVNGETKVKSRQRRGLYLSVIRSALFNQVLASRVTSKNWDTPVNGDVMMLDGSHSVFCAADVDDTLRQRVLAADIHPTGPLWGAGEGMVMADAAGLEHDALVEFESWCRALETVGLKQQRRALRVIPQGFDWQFAGDNTNVVLNFSLTSGAYATAVLRELFIYSDGSTVMAG
jgi:tRNA pseudouridine13 synthase